MQTASRSREPRSKAMLRPARWMKLNSTGTLDEEHAQIAISTLGDAAQYRAITGRHLPRYQAQPRGKVAPFCKGASVADRSDHRTCDDRADARNGHQPSTAHVSTSQTFYLIRHPLDPLIKMCPILDEIFNDSDHTGRQDIGARGHDLRQLLPQEAMPLADGNAMLEQKAAKLIDHCCSIADQPRNAPDVALAGLVDRQSLSERSVSKGVAQPPQ